MCSRSNRLAPLMSFAPQNICVIMVPLIRGVYGAWRNPGVGAAREGVAPPGERRLVELASLTPGSGRPS